MKAFIVLSISFFLLCSCNSNFDQSYFTYSELEKANIRNKAWFPKLIDSDCYAIKGRINLEVNENVGRFSYKNKSVVDSIKAFKSGSQSINTNTFQIILVDMQMNLPEWFLTKDKVIGKSIWQSNGVYYAQDSFNHVIYFLSKRKEVN